MNSVFHALLAPSDAVEMLEGIDMRAASFSHCCSRCLKILLAKVIICTVAYLDKCYSSEV